MRQESDGKGDSLVRLLLEIRATLFGCVVAGLLGRRSPFFCGEREERPDEVGTPRSCECQFFLLSAISVAMYLSTTSRVHVASS